MTGRDQAVLIPEMMSHGKRPSLRALTSIRFFAAIYVVFMHCDFQDIPGIPSLVARFMASGYTAVTLFFALSGFILAYNYPRLASRRDFWISRFARIYPVYAVALLLSLLLNLANAKLRNQPGLLPAAIFSLLLVQSWLPGYVMLINSVAWTLSVEAFFYATFPLLNPYCRRPARLALGLFVATYLGLTLAPIAVAHHNFTAGLDLANAMDATMPIFRLGTFIVGMLAGARYARNASHSVGLLPLSLLSTLLLLLWSPANLYRPLKTMLLSCTYTGIMFALAAVNKGPLMNRWLLLGGEISYSIYLLQFLIFRICRGGIVRVFAGAQINNVAFVPVLLLVSYLSFRFIEVPGRRHIRNLSRRSLATD